MRLLVCPTAAEEDIALAAYWGRWTLVAKRVVECERYGRLNVYRLKNIIISRTGYVQMVLSVRQRD